MCADKQASSCGRCDLTLEERHQREECSCQESANAHLKVPQNAQTDAKASNQSSGYEH